MRVSAKRFKPTAETKRQAKKNANYDKKFTEVNTQPEKHGKRWVGNVSFVWLNGPHKGQNAAQRVMLTGPAKLRLKNKKIEVSPTGSDHGEPYFYGEEAVDEPLQPADDSDLGKFEPKDKPASTPPAGAMIANLAKLPEPEAVSKMSKLISGAKRLGHGLLDVLAAAGAKVKDAKQSAALDREWVKRIKTSKLSDQDFKLVKEKSTSVGANEMTESYGYQSQRAKAANEALINKDYDAFEDEYLRLRLAEKSDDRDWLNKVSNASAADLKKLDPALARKAAAKRQKVENDKRYRKTYVFGLALQTKRAEDMTRAFQDVAQSPEYKAAGKEKQTKMEQEEADAVKRHREKQAKMKKKFADERKRKAQEKRKAEEDAAARAAGKKAADEADAALPEAADEDVIEVPEAPKKPKKKAPTKPKAEQPISIPADDAPQEEWDAYEEEQRLRGLNDAGNAEKERAKQKNEKKPKTKAPNALAKLSPKKLDAIKGSIKPKFTWKDSDAKEESEELTRAAEETGLDPDEVKAAFSLAKTTELSDKDWEKLENTDSWETTTVAKAAKAAEEYQRDWRRVVDGLTSGAEMPRSIVLKKPDGTTTLVGGNTRLMVMRALGIRPEVMVVDLS